MTWKRQRNDQPQFLERQVGSQASALAAVSEWPDADRRAWEEACRAPCGCEIDDNVEFGRLRDRRGRRFLALRMRLVYVSMSPCIKSTVVR
jgi:hypothetical protein